MGKYPKRFVDKDGYEWERGPFYVVDNAVKKETHGWRFRPTAKYALWKKLSIREHYWDYADDEHLAAWKIKIAKTLR